MIHPQTLLILSVLCLSGCLHSPVKPEPKSDPALLVLADVAKEVRATTRRVSAIQDANNPAYVPIRTTDPALMQTITVLDYVGSPATLLARICVRSGYSFHDQSTSAIRLAPITVSVEQEPVILVIQDIAAQIGRSADLVLNETDRSLRLVSR